MNIHVILIGYALANELGNLLRTLSGSDVTFHLFLHSGNSSVENVCIHASDWPNVHYYPYGVNRGLAKSWNEGLVNAYAEGADTVVIANDDLVMTHNDLLVLAQAAVEHPECGIIVAEGFNVRMDEKQQLQFAIPAINKSALEQIGYFDENFTPIYFEDSDYSRRAALAGVKFHNAGTTGIVHTGSATVGAVDELRLQNSTTFRLNYEYYCRKWGGSPGQETFTYPFNDTRFGLKITAEDRHHPYQEKDRQDVQEIVKL